MPIKPIKNKREFPDLSRKVLEKRLLQADGHAKSQEELKLMEIRQRDTHHGEAQPARDAMVVLQHGANKKLDEISQKLDKPEVQKIEIEGAEVVTIKGKQGDQGEPGKTPEKGKDYFTKEDIDQIKKDVLDKIPKPADGITPKKGTDYFTEKEIQQIKTDILKQIPKPKDGEHGKDAVIDYEIIISSVIEKVLEKIPKKPPKQKKITADYIIKLIRENIQYKDIKNAPQWKPGKMNGKGYLGEITDVALENLVDGQVIRWNSNKQKFENSTPSFTGMWNEELPIAGEADGENIVFVFEHIPELVFSDGTVKSILMGDYTVDGNEVTFVNAPLALPVNKYLS